MSGVIVFVVVCLSIAALIAVGAYWWVVDVWYKGEPPGSGLRKCRACGKIYHKSWGSICANCSGAD